MAPRLSFCPSHLPVDPTFVVLKGDGLGEGEATIGEEWAFVPPTPLFKLKPGTTSNSHGIACAQVAGKVGQLLIDFQTE